MKLLKLFSGILLIFSFILNANPLATNWQQEFHLDWDSVNLSDDIFWSSLTFPKNFKWGVATKASDLEGTSTHSGKFIQNDYTINNPDREFDEGCDNWNDYIKDIELLKKLGVNQYRFNIPWEKIEPEEGQFDEQAITHYIDLCKYLRKENIEPIVCLFHFRLPLWFADQGRFEKSENMQKFIRFAQFVFDNLNKYVSTWITYNEPIAYVMEAYHTAKYPPYRKGFFYLRQAGTVLKNMLNAHVDIYQAFKEKNPEAQIGFVKMFHMLDSYQDLFAEKLIIKGANHIIYDSIFEFFKTGHFNWFWLMHDYNPNATQALDYIGVNYYSHELIQATGYFSHKRLKAREYESKTELGRAIYPEGLYRAILKAQELNVPIYITENGIADPNDSLRNEFIKKHLYIINCAINDGIPIKGYAYWTFMDKSGYGLYKFDPRNKSKILRSDAIPFVNFLAEQKLLNRV
ncbi:MAG: family 1 glycosylhydrolase [Candidatus Babeliales bacterium]